MFPPPFMSGGTDISGAPIPFSDSSLGASPDHATENVDWRAMYLGELERLKNITKEQDKQGAPQDWYRMMLMRLRLGMVGLPPFTVSTEDGVGVNQNEAGGDSGVMEEEEED
jgi:forkhead box protein J2/3